MPNKKLTILELEEKLSRSHAIQHEILKRQEPLKDKLADLIRDYELIGKRITYYKREIRSRTGK